MGVLYWDTELANRWGATLNSAPSNVKCGAVTQRWIKKTWYLAPKGGQFSYRMYSLWLNVYISYLNGHPKFLFIWFLGLLVPFHSPNVFLGLLVKNSLWSVGSSGMPPLPSACPGSPLDAQLPVYLHLTFMQEWACQSNSSVSHPHGLPGLGFEPKRWCGLTHSSFLPCGLSQVPSASW